ncbi:unnamed protein product [Caenorhabditis bovis]|uniref:RNA helicase n=1 Tax=Caenorhabditis bovis TaxID=2654633 RepID=A0A8S1EKF9_9PELO|nr:unnamed protein product [Caenorhabditis bovis]
MEHKIDEPSGSLVSKLNEATFLSEKIRDARTVSIDLDNQRQKYRECARNLKKTNEESLWVFNGTTFLKTTKENTLKILEHDAKTVDETIEKIKSVIKMGDNDIKQFLYAWLGRNKFSAPNYDIKSETRGGRMRFKCELRVPGMPYCALGNSTNKKDAATNAAMDFCQYLVREGKITQNQIPSLTSASLDGANTSWHDHSGNQDSTFFAENNSSVEAVGNSSSFQENRINQKPRLPWNNAYTRENTTHQEYMAQKAEEIAHSETIDLKSEIHGGWTMDNSKKALHEYVQKMKLQPVVYNTTIRESNFVKTMETTTVVYVPQLRKNLTGKGSGSNKKVSEAACAMNLVRQMFHLNIMQAYGGPQRKDPVSTLPEIELKIPDELANRVKDYVTNCGIDLKYPNPGIATADSPVSILADQKLLQFPDSDITQVSNVSWAPPMQNWNPWRASNIDEPPLAFMTMQQISEKITEKENAKQQSDMLEKSIQARQVLPVWQYHEEIIKTVANNRVTLIKGETGCGKSTQVAQFLLDDYISRGVGSEFNIVVSQPRRISAISLAERVANERIEELGETVGFNVRFDGVSPRPYGSIMFCTVGVLLRMMENGLRGISHIVIDEIHERDVDTDFVLIVLREMISEYKDLRVILMSATIDTTLFTEFFGQNPSIGTCPVIKMHGRTFPVQSFFLEDILNNLQYMPDEPDRKKKRNQPDEDEGEEEVDDKGKNMNIIDDPNVNQSLRIAMSRLSEKEIPYGVIEAILSDIAKRGVDGAVLIFLPGWSDIMLLFNRLTEHPEFSQSSKYEILPLHSQLTSSEQRKVFNHYEGKRKIILSTNIAETSITIDDVVYVIDSCKAKERMYTSNNNMVHFATVWASRTNIIQRRGRAGRVRAGYAFHLCSSKRFEALDEHGTAEMLRIPLHQIALTIKLLRLGSVGDFLGKALEPPPYDMVVESEAVLQNMGAFDRNLELTSLGKMLARMPIEPVIAKVMILGTALGLSSVMCDVAAAMSFSTPFVPRERHHTRLNGQQRKFGGNKFSDHVALVAVTQAYRETNELGSMAAEHEFCERYSLSYPILKMTYGARRQLVDVLRNQCCFPDDVLYDIKSNVNQKDRELDLMRSLLVMALYPNVCYFTGKRKVLTIEQASALLNKYSILNPMNSREDFGLPSPLLVFTEKVRSRCISCKELSVITALQLLVFGCRKVECIGENLVRLDNMITLRIDVETASALVALRPCIEAFLVRSCENPESLSNTNPQDSELRQLLRDISSEEFMQSAGPLKDSLLTDNAQIAAKLIPPPTRGFNASDWLSDGGGKMPSPRNQIRPDHPYNSPGPSMTQSNDNFMGPPNSSGDWHRNNQRGGGYARGGRGGYRGGYNNNGTFGRGGGYRGGRGRGRGWSVSNW